MYSKFNLKFDILTNDRFESAVSGNVFNEVNLCIVRLDNTRVIRDLQRYLDEVIKHLSSTDNCNVELSLEVNAETPTGFSQETVRTVSENCRTLNVSNFGFEKEEH